MTAGERAAAPGERRIRPGRSPGLTPVLVGLLLAGALVGLRGGFAPPGLHGPLRHDGIGVGIALETVLAVLLSALLIRQRRQPAADFATRRLRTVLRAVLLAGLVAIPVILVADAPLRGYVRTRAPTGPRLPGRPSARPTRLTPPSSVHFPLSAVLYTLLGLVLLAAIAAIVLVLIRHRPADQDALPPEDASLAEGERTDLRAAVQSGQRALAELDDARAAIIACYLAMERSLAAAGADRTEADTPAEFLDRAAARPGPHGRGRPADRAVLRGPVLPARAGRRRAQRRRARPAPARRRPGQGRPMSTRYGPELTIAALTATAAAVAGYALAGPMAVALVAMVSGIAGLILLRYLVPPAPPRRTGRT